MRCGKDTLRVPRSIFCHRLYFTLIVPFQQNKQKTIVSLRSWNMNVDDPMESDPASSSYWFDILREQSSNSILPWKDSDDFKLIESLPILQDDDDYILDEQLEETEESSSTSCSSSSCCLSRAMDELHQRETLPKLKTTEEEKEKVSDTRHHRTPRLEPTEEELQEALNTRQRRALKTFYHRLKDLVQFIKEYQHSDVPQKFDKNPQLGT